MTSETRNVDASRFDLAAEAIALRIRWFGVVAGFLLVNLRATEVVRDVTLLNMILVLGVFYVAVDTVLSLRGKVFLGRLSDLVNRGHLARSLFELYGVMTNATTLLDTLT